MRVLAALLLVIGVAQAQDDWDDDCGRETVPEHLILHDATVLNGYVIEQYRNPETMFEDALIIRRDGLVMKEVLACGAHDVITPKNAAEHWWYQSEAPDAVSTDFDGDGLNDLLVFFFTGGAHCCSGYRIFSLTDEVRLLAKGEPKEYGYGIDDVNGDGVVELRSADDAFAYWYASYAESPGPRVILGYDKRSNGMRANPDLMRAPKPLRAELEVTAAEVRAKFTPENTEHLGFAQDERPWAPLMPAVWGEMLQLIYSGHPDAAMTFLDLVWPPGKAGKDAFVGDLQEQLKNSRYAEDLGDWIKLTP